MGRSEGLLARQEKEKSLSMGSTKKKEEVAWRLDGGSDQWDMASVASEVVFGGQVLQQVGEVSFSPELEKIRFFHRLQGELQVAEVGAGVTLKEWQGDFAGWEGEDFLDGFFCNGGRAAVEFGLPGLQAWDWIHDGSRIP